MSDYQETTSTRLQTILTELLQIQLSKSLQRMDESLEEWRSGGVGAFEAHAEVLKHAARAERMATRVAKAQRGEVDALLRDAFDAGLLGREEFTSMSGKSPDDVAPAGGLDDGLSTPLKRDLVSELLSQGPVLVHVNARIREVSVPQHLSRDPKLVLRFGYGLSPAIPDLDVDEHGMSGTLTFGGVPHHCILPWPAVYAVVSEADQRGMVWPEDVPKTVLEEMASRSELPPGPTPAARASSTSDEPARDDRTPTTRRASHLKLVD